MPSDMLSSGPTCCSKQYMASASVAYGPKARKPWRFPSGPPRASAIHIIAFPSHWHNSGPTRVMPSGPAPACVNCGSSSTGHTSWLGSPWVEIMATSVAFDTVAFVPPKLVRYMIVLLCSWMTFLIDSLLQGGTYVLLLAFIACSAARIVVKLPR